MTFREIYEAYKADIFNLALHYTGNVPYGLLEKIMLRIAQQKNKVIHLVCVSAAAVMPDINETVRGAAFC